MVFGSCNLKKNYVVKLINPFFHCLWILVIITNLFPIARFSSSTYIASSFKIYIPYAAGNLYLKHLPLDT